MTTNYTSYLMGIFIIQFPLQVAIHQLDNMGFTGAVHTKQISAAHSRRGYEERIRRKALKDRAPAKERLGARNNQRKLRPSDRPTGRDRNNIRSTIHQINNQDRPSGRENNRQEPRNTRQKEPEIAVQEEEKKKKKEEKKERRRAKQEKKRQERREELVQIVTLTAKAVATEIGHLLVKKGLTAAKKKKMK